MLVERLGPSEAERLRVIRLAALRDAPEAFCSTYDETAARPMESWQAQVRELPTFVAVDDARDVGMARTAPHADRPGVHGIISMWVDPAVRGKGVGRALVDAIIDWARSHAATDLLLEVADDNAPAVALYARMGFVPTGATSTMPPPREHRALHERALRLQES